MRCIRTKKRRDTIINIEESIFRTYTNSINIFYVKGNTRAMENIFEYILYTYPNNLNTCSNAHSKFPAVKSHFFDSRK